MSSSLISCWTALQGDMTYLNLKPDGTFELSDIRSTGGKITGTWTQERSLFRKKLIFRINETKRTVTYRYKILKDDRLGTDILDLRCGDKSSFDNWWDRGRGSAEFTSSWREPIWGG
jgi:hypothetical protein